MDPKEDLKIWKEAAKLEKEVSLEYAKEFLISKGLLEREKPV